LRSGSKSLRGFQGASLGLRIAVLEFEVAPLQTELLGAVGSPETLRV